MSNQRRMRAELRQGLHQFLMQLFFSYSESLGKQEAMDMILEVLDEQYTYFAGESKPKASTLSDTARQIEAEARDCQSYDEQMRLYDYVETLVKAQEILEERERNVSRNY